VGETLNGIGVPKQEWEELKTVVGLKIRERDLKTPCGVEVIWKYTRN
jgi:hypothetical protein